MNMSSAELKTLAKRALKGNYVICIAAQFLLSFIIFLFLIPIYVMMFMGIIGFSTTNSPKVGMIIMFALIIIFLILILFCITGLLWPGFYKICLNICKGQPAGMIDILYAFKNKPHKFLGLYFVLTIMGIVFLIPYYVVAFVTHMTGYIPIMLVLEYLMLFIGLFGTLVLNLYIGQAMFIFIESQDKKVFASLKESIDMMKGHKGRLFYISISFIGMFILGYASFGIGFYWIGPYMQCTLTEFYLQLKADSEQKSIADVWDDSCDHRIQQENTQ